MARKIIDIIPAVTATPTDGPMVTGQAEAQLQADGMVLCLKAALGGGYDFATSFRTDAICEHCRAPWTEAGDAYNGGCCGLDEANDPVRLRDLRTLAEAIDEAVFYSFDEGECGRVAIDWPNLLAGAVIDWLDAGRPADRIAALVPLAQRCDGRDWCTVWSDPGPSGCSLARLPDRVVADESPNQLAQELCSLLDDMGLLPARKVVA